MSQLSYMSPRGAGHVRFGSAAELGLLMWAIRHPATLRSDRGAVIGRTDRCDGTCDGQCRGWHWWYDPTGDDVRPEAT